MTQPKQGRRSHKRGTLSDAAIIELDQLPATDKNGMKALLAAVLTQAIEDITYGHRDAVTFIESPLAAHYADLIGVNPVAMVERARALAAQHQPQAWSRYNPKHLRVAFDAYVAGEMSLAEIERRFTTRQETLRGLWAQLGLVHTDNPHYARAQEIYNDWVASGLTMREYDRQRGNGDGYMTGHCRKWGFPTKHVSAPTMWQIQDDHRQWRESGLSIAEFERRRGLTRNTLGKRFRRVGLNTSRDD